MSLNRANGGEDVAESTKRRPSPRWFTATTDWGFGNSIWSDKSLIISLNIVLFTILFCMHVLDVWSTIIVLMNGGEEANPITLWFMSTLGAYTGLIVFKSYVILVSGLLVKTWIDSPVVSCSLALVTVTMANMLLIINLPLVLLIYGG